MELPSPAIQYFGAQFYKIWTKGSFWKKKILKIISRQAEKYAVKQKVLSFQEDGKKRKMVIKIEFTPLSKFKLQCFTFFFLNSKNTQIIRNIK